MPIIEIPNNDKQTVKRARRANCILVWPCQNCGTRLSETDHFILTKWCDDCRLKLKRMRGRESIQRKRRSDAGKMTLRTQRIDYLLRTNKRVFLHEMKAYTGFTLRSIENIIYRLRNHHGYNISCHRKEGNMVSRLYVLHGVNNGK